MATPNRKQNNDLKRIRINSIKLFYYRHILHFQIEVLASMTRIPVKQLRQYELGINCPDSGPTKISHFPEIPENEFAELERTLKCEGKLSVGLSDDFATSFIAYRNMYFDEPLTGGTHTQLMMNWKAKAVVFDFDGTLTKSGSTRTTWESVWQTLGYNDNECGLLARRFFIKDKKHPEKIDHPEWCRLTLEKFKARNLTQSQVIAVAANIELIADFDECMMEVERLGIPAYIVSGSIWDVIIHALGYRAKFFKFIESNTFGYNPDKTIGTITGTKFDFEGKGDYVSELAKKLKIKTADILFVGNSINDVHVKSTGARTLLVNPHFTAPSDPAWDFYIPRMSSLLEVLPYIDYSWDQRRNTLILEERERASVALKDLNELRLASISVLGKYRRFSNEDRANLVGLADRIRRALREKSQTRENFLVYASPGSGKTFFVEELARTLSDTIKFVPIDLSLNDREACVAKLEEVAGSDRPCLCMIDEVDGRKGEDWPYDLIYKKLDLNEIPNRSSVIFVMIGSSGGTVQKLGEAIRSRYKGKDMIDRVLESAQHCAEIPSMGIGDTVCVYASKILEAADSAGKTIQEIEKFAAYHAVLTCRTPRQIKLLADQAVRRIPAGHTQVHYDHHFESGDETNKTFWQLHSGVAKDFGKQTFRVSE
ncbi:MAG: HAD family hydrolase [Gemmataceae bacterium]